MPQQLPAKFSASRKAGFLPYKGKSGSSSQRQVPVKLIRIAAFCEYGNHPLRSSLRGKIVHQTICLPSFNLRLDPSRNLVCWSRAVRAKKKIILVNRRNNRKCWLEDSACARWRCSVEGAPWGSAIRSDCRNACGQWPRVCRQAPRRAWNAARACNAPSVGERCGYILLRGPVQQQLPSRRPEAPVNRPPGYVAPPFYAAPAWWRRRSCARGAHGCRGHDAPHK